MGQILIRNLDDAVIRRLKQRAARHRTSAEEEARRVLTAGAGIDRDILIARLNAVAKANGPQTGPTSTELLRADRDRDQDR